MIFDKVKSIIAEQLDIDEASITLESAIIDDLGADSLDIVDLVMSFEDEFDTEISLEDARDLMRSCEPGIIDKTRYLVKTSDGRHVWEIDEFYGDNEGLILAEIELDHEYEEFEKPDFIGREVTGDRRFYNSHMRNYPFKLWKEEILEAK